MRRGGERTTDQARSGRCCELASELARPPENTIMSSRDAQKIISLEEGWGNNIKPNAINVLEEHLNRVSEPASQRAPGRSSGVVVFLGLCRVFARANSLYLHELASGSNGRGWTGVIGCICLALATSPPSSASLAKMLILLASSGVGLWRRPSSFV